MHDIEAVFQEAIDRIAREASEPQVIYTTVGVKRRFRISLGIGPEYEAMFNVQQLRRAQIRELCRKRHP